MCSTYTCAGAMNESRCGSNYCAGGCNTNGSGYDCGCSGVCTSTCINGCSSSCGGNCETFCRNSGCSGIINEKLRNIVHEL